MKRIFNLSYDITENETIISQIPQEERLQSETFVDFLYESGILIIDKPFHIIHKDGRRTSHYAVKPVESTIIFISEMGRKEIAKVLNQHKDLYYVLTEIQRKGKSKGSLHYDESDDGTQNGCDKKLRQIKCQQVVEEVASRVITRIKREYPDFEIDLEN